MRCDEFYEKSNKEPNFCEKSPRTAEQIEAYLDEMQKLGVKSGKLLIDEELRRSHKSRFLQMPYNH